MHLKKVQDRNDGFNLCRFHRSYVFRFMARKRNWILQLQMLIERRCPCLCPALHKHKCPLKMLHYTSLHKHKGLIFDLRTGEIGADSGKSLLKRLNDHDL